MSNKIIQYRLIDLLEVRPTKFKPISFLQRFLKDRFFSVYGEHVDLCHFFTPANQLFTKKKKQTNFLYIMKYPDEFMTETQEVPVSLDLDDRCPIVQVHLVFYA